MRRRARPADRRIVRHTGSTLTGSPKAAGKPHGHRPGGEDLLNSLAKPNLPLWRKPETKTIGQRRTNGTEVMSNDNSRSAAWRIFRISRTFALAAALAVSLTANATLFVGGVIYDVIDTFVEGVSGLQTASALQRRALSKLQGQNRQLRVQAQTVRSENRRLRAKVQNIRTVVPSTVKRTRQRLFDSAKRSVTSLPGKALPVAGTGVSVAMTALLIKDLCATLEDLDRMERAAGLSDGTDDTQTQVCSMNVPTEDEVWAVIESSPKKVWEASKRFASDLNELPNSRELAREFQEQWRSFLRLLE